MALNRGVLIISNYDILLHEFMVGSQAQLDVMIETSVKSLFRSKIDRDICMYETSFDSVNNMVFNGSLRVNFYNTTTKQVITPNLDNIYLKYRKLVKLEAT